MPRLVPISRWGGWGWGGGEGGSRCPAGDAVLTVQTPLLVNFKSGFDCLPTMRLWEKTV